MKDKGIKKEQAKQGGSHILTVRLEGMTCPACQRRVRRLLLAIDRVTQADVSFATGEARIASSKKITEGDVRRALSGTDYHLAGEAGAKSASYIAVALVFALYFILKGTGLLSRFSLFPQVGDGTTLLALLGVGFLTSFHCVAMCGAINLGQSNLAAKGGSSPLAATIAFHAGRLVSYTAIGAVVGLLGSVFALSPTVQGLILVAAGVLMAAAALNLAGAGGVLRRLVPRLSSRLFRSLEARLSKKGSFALGVLNGFMPCGPLQSMQVYALGTGSALRGAAAMCAFCLGTVPVLFAVGFAGARMSRRFSRWVGMAQAAAILLMALSTAANGLALAGVTLPTGDVRGMQVSGAGDGGDPIATAEATREGNTAKASGGQADKAKEGRVQRVSSSASYASFEPICVVRGLPVEWTLTVPEGQLTGCNAVLVIPQWRIKVPLTEGDNLITFTPQVSGTFAFSCWMGMIQSYIAVVDA